MKPLAPAPTPPEDRNKPGAEASPAAFAAPDPLSSCERKKNTGTGMPPDIRHDPEIKAGDDSLTEPFIRLWEASVKATHAFLAEEDRLFYQSFLPVAFTEVDMFYLAASDGSPAGFIGIAGDKIEMLFIHPSAQGQGLGKRLMNFAIQSRQACRVDVNEQNVRALGFYYKLGFELIGRDAEDGYGKPYPILHLRLKT